MQTRHGLTENSWSRGCLVPYADWPQRLRRSCTFRASREQWASTHPLTDPSMQDGKWSEPCPQKKSELCPQKKQAVGALRLLRNSTSVSAEPEGSISVCAIAHSLSDKEANLRFVWPRDWSTQLIAEEPQEMES